MRYSFYGDTNVGKVRDHNEDAFLTSDTFVFGMVSDGMGGLAAGEVASQTTKESVLTTFENAKPEDSLTHIVNEAITLANTNVRKVQREKPEANGMGCTCVLLAFRKNDYCIGYVGDSRIYRYRDNCLKQLTTDHSYVEELFRRGLIKEEGKANHYYLTEEGFHIYPIGVPINIYTHGNAKPAGTAIVKEVVLRENKTIALYELVALSSVN